MASRRVPKKAIPWQFSSSGEFLQYEWDNPGADANSTFRALVICESGAWSWSLEAGLAVKPLWRIGGPAADKATCEELVCEAIAKAFQATGPYRDLVDAAGQRYTVAEGRRLDLADLAGRRVRVELSNGEIVQGTLRTGGWNLELIDLGRTYSVNPVVVASVVAA